jgi:nucleoside permease NupC
MVTQYLLTLMTVALVVQAMVIRVQSQRLAKRIIKEQYAFQVEVQQVHATKQQQILIMVTQYLLTLMTVALVVQAMVIRVQSQIQKKGTK